MCIKYMKQQGKEEFVPEIIEDAKFVFEYLD